MSYIVYAWIASILYGVVVIGSKLTTKYAIKNPWLLNYVWSLALLIFTLPLAITHHVGLPHNWLLLIFLGIAGIMVWICYVLALYLLDVSVISPLYNFRTAISVLLGGLFLGEILSFTQYALILVIICCGILVTYDEKLKLKSFFQKAVLIAMAGIFFSAIQAVLTKPSVAQNGYWETTLWSAVLIQVGLISTFPKFKHDIRKLTKKQIGAVACISALEVGALLALNKAYAANVSISSTITSLPISMILAFLFSFFAPRVLEHHPLRVYIIRLLAAAIMIVAALKLSA